MKKGFLTVALALAALSAYGQSGGIVSLDEAIRDSAAQIQNGFDRGSTVIVYQFQSQNAKVSDYVLKELFNLLVNSYRFIVLDRSAQMVVDAELDFQFNRSAGMISDDSLASLTKRIGAQAIVTGSLDDAGGEYRFRIRVIGTETTAAIVSYAVSVSKNDRRVAALAPQEKNTGEKIGTGALNILFGLGSYLEGDITGGVTITGGYAAAIGLFVIEAAALDWDSPAVGVPATIGVTAAGLAIVYGFARPFIYNHSPKAASVMDNAQPRIAITSDLYGSHIGFQASYTIKF
jgi:hypothetical protein